MSDENPATPLRGQSISLQQAVKIARQILAAAEAEIDADRQREARANDPEDYRVQIVSNYNEAYDAGYRDGQRNVFQQAAEMADGRATRRQPAKYQGTRDWQDDYVRVYWDVRDWCMAKAKDLG